MVLPTGHTLFGVEFHLEEKNTFFELTGIAPAERSPEDLCTLAALLHNVPFFRSVSKEGT